MISVNYKSKNKIAENWKRMAELSRYNPRSANELGEYQFRRVAQNEFSNNGHSERFYKLLEAADEMEESNKVERKILRKKRRGWQA